MRRGEPIDFVVEGRGYFPLDMLRYDQCWPTDPNSVENIGFDIVRAPPRRVRLRTVNWHGPTIERWNSFNWKVVNADAPVKLAVED